MPKLIAIAIVIALTGSAHAAGPMFAKPQGAAEPTRALRAGLHNDPPFSIKKGDQWSGIAVDLLRQIASELGMRLEITDIPAERIVSGPLPDVDVVATLGVSERMNARYELSHAFFSQTLAIATIEAKKESILAMLGRIFSGTFVLILACVFVLLTLVGLLMWWFEKRPVDPLPKEKAALSKALFWAFEPVIGYKASQHTTRAGRVLGTIWGLFGVVMVSGLTANLAAQLTARRLAPTLSGPQDLPRVTVGVVEHTTGRKYCDRHGIPRVEFASLADALAAVEQGKVEAVVDEQTTLQYALRANPHPKLTILPATFYTHGSAFGLMPDSPLRKDFNTALIKSTLSDTWASTIASYLGRAD
jgi:polar amino acid transport system substrate-binding protein